MTPPVCPSRPHIKVCRVPQACLRLDYSKKQKSQINTKQYTDVIKSYLNCKPLQIAEVTNWLIGLPDVHFVGAEPQQRVQHQTGGQVIGLTQLLHTHSSASVHCLPPSACCSHRVKATVCQLTTKTTNHIHRVLSISAAWQTNDTRAKHHFHPRWLKLAGSSLRIFILHHTLTINTW